MSQLAERIVDLPLADDLGAQIEEAARLSDGDASLAVDVRVLGQRSTRFVTSASSFAGYVHRNLS